MIREIFICLQSAQAWWHRVQLPGIPVSGTGTPLVPGNQFPSGAYIVHITWADGLVPGSVPGTWYQEVIVFQVPVSYLSPPMPVVNIALLILAISLHRFTKNGEEKTTSGSQEK